MRLFDPFEPEDESFGTRSVKILTNYIGSYGYFSCYSVKEGFGEYGYTEFDPDPDLDSDFDKI